MRLRTKLFLVAAGVGLVPIVVAAALGRAEVERRARAEFEQLLEDGEARVRRRLKQLRAQVSQSVERLADPEDHFIGRLLIAEAKRQADNRTPERMEPEAISEPDDVTSRQLPLATPRVMRERGLELLLVVGPNRRVVASGHFPGRIGDSVSKAELGRSGQVRLANARVLQDGRPVTRVTIQRWQRARSPLGATLLVMGGRLVDLERLGLGGAMKLQLRDPAGRVLLGPKAVQGSYPERVIPLRGGAGRVLATITLAVPDDRLRGTLRLIDYVAAGLVLAAVALGLFLAGFARLITRPLEELVEAAGAVAAGQLDRRIPVRSRDEVGELVAAFNRMTSQLEESKQRLQAAERVAAWREIARAIAHELKNPLFPIQTAIETLRKVHQRKHPSFEEVFDESTVTILEEVERLKRIVGEFSGFARMPKPRVAPFAPAEWLRSTVALYQSAQVPVQLDLAADLPQLVGDREQLTQVVVNLLKNAQDATRATESPRIEIGLRQLDELVVLSVHDNGPGFSAETADRLFTPYFTTKGRSGGTGLGLAVCQRIVTEHGGTIEARGELGAGATFIVRLPLVVGGG